MAGVCCDVVSETEAAVAAAASVESSSSRSSRRRRLDLLPVKIVADAAAVAPPESSNSRKRKLENQERENEVLIRQKQENHEFGLEEKDEIPKFGMISVCGRRRDMEDAVSIHASFDQENSHFFGVYDGHGCSHVATKCKDRLHHIVKEEIQSQSQEEGSIDWKLAMERSYERMDKEVENCGDTNNKCRCELQAPHCDAVGSTAVSTVVTPDKIIVSNCGDSRAVLCRNGIAIPLSSDHKPDRPDELERIEAAGGRVIYWDGARVLGVLAMSRAIGDNYLKPFVIPEPEVMVMDRTDEDEYLILASDGLWDVVTNETACGVAKMCLQGRKPVSPPGSSLGFIMADSDAVESSDKACYEASILLTKLALARQSTDNVSVLVVDLRRNPQIR